jgi:hypothetical protein
MVFAEPADLDDTGHQRGTEDVYDVEAVVISDGSLCWGNERLFFRPVGLRDSFWALSFPVFSSDLRGLVAGA